MLHKKKVSLLRKGIAAFLLLLMLGSGFAFAADGTKNTETTKSTESVQPEHMDDGEQNAQDEKETVSAATDESTEKPTETTDVEVEAGTEDAEELVEEIKEEEQIVIFAQGNDRVNKTVKLYYNKKVKYENYRTHDFHVTCDGEKIVAYCIEPTQRLGKVRTFTATPCDSALLSKALYYSYGNPGYNTRSATYLNGLNLKSCYDSTTGRYAFCHVMLSYIFDGESTKGDAFKGCSSNTKTNVKKFVSAIKSWPNPPAKSELGLSSTAFEASWNEELGMQETPEISVTGTEGNSINVPVPDKVTMVKGEEIITTGSVKMSVGESFRLRAPAGLQGQYISPALATAMTDFQPYIIKLSGKQDQMFGINRAQTISYTIKWADFGKVELIKTSSDPSVTDGNGYYSLQGAEYGLYSKETDKKYGNLITDVEGKASIENIPYGEYYLKELEPSRGYDIDVKAHDITVASPSQSETVLEKPIVP
ncbi:MAG: prealbumin-like fold domain-containing protein, partial [Clostridia bacterium]|nr:prealbumin-like fold domain-containing protein [Clostridia bacterium]